MQLLFRILLRLRAGKSVLLTSNMNKYQMENDCNVRYMRMQKAIGLRAKCNSILTCGLDAVFHCLRSVSNSTFTGEKKVSFDLGNTLFQFSNEPSIH